MAAATYSQHFDTVQKIYIAFYQRPADPGGLKYWAEQIELAGNASAVVAAFATSKEATDLYKTINDSTIDGVIDQIYLALFNRAPDVDGKKIYVEGFKAGTFTAGSIALDILNGARNADKTAIDNKAAVANLFTAQVDGRSLTDAGFGTGPFAATYNQADELAARAILVKVQADTATILTAAQVTQQIQINIADAGDTINVFSLIASASSVNEGASVTFDVVGAQANFTYSYELSGVVASDVTGALTGSVTTDANGKGKITVALANDRATEGAETLTVTLPNTGKSASVTVNDTSLVNIAPVAVAATANAIEDGAVVTGQLAATDADGDALTFTLTTAAQGLTINADGSYSFDPSKNDTVKALTTAGGSKDVVATYTVTDALGATATSTLTITAAPAPLSFSIAAGATTVNEDGSITFTVTANEAVAAATDVVFTLVPGNGIAVNQGTATTNLNDFGQGAFNPVTKTILAGGTTATFTITPPNDDITELAESFSVEAVVGGKTLSATALLLDGATGAGKTFMLTKGLDNIAGTAGNDTIIASIDNTVAPGTPNAELQTLSNLDIVNGGAGVDTLSINVTGGTGVVLPNMTNVEIVKVESTAGVTIDTSAVAGVTDLNVLKHGSAAVGATAAATTNVAVTLKENGAGSALASTVQGGNNVTVTAADAGATANPDTIAIGGTTAPKGDVVVNVTGKAYDAATGNVGFGTVAITGGKTVSVTQKATSDATKAAVDKGADTVTQGAVTVNATADTTTINVKQDATVAAKIAADTTGGVTETATIKFGALKTNDTLAVNGLTFKALENLTGDQVAAAFSNMISGLAVTNKDTQGSQVAAKGTFTGAFATGADTAAGYTAAAASGDTVVFTAARANQEATDLAIGSTITLTNTSGTSVAPTVTTVQGKVHNATPAGGVMGVAAGKVTIGGDAAATAVKTITVDGYSTTLSAITGTTSALDTLNLSNGGNFTVAAAAETLALNLKNVGTAAKAATLTSDVVNVAVAALNLDSIATKTLNVKSDGGNTVAFNLATATTALNVSGTGLLDASTSTDIGGVTTIKVTETAGLNLGATATTTVTSVDTTGTTGAVTIALDGGKATYVGGAGKDSVTVNAVTGTFNKTINLGAGDDTLTLTNGALTAAVLKAIPTANALQGGEGTDTIVLTAANAVELSADAVFAGKIDGFEKLSVGNATTAGTVNLANLDSINYVISANSVSAPSAGVDENALVTFKNLNAGEVVTVAGRTVTVAVGTSATAADIAAAYLSNASTATLTVGGTLVGWAPSASAAGVLKFTSTTPATNVADVSTLISDTALAAATAVGVGTATQGTAGTAESTAWTMSGLTNGQSYTIAGRVVTANKTLTATEVATAFTSGTTLAGSYTVSGTYTAPTTWTAGTFSNVAGALTLTNGANGDVTDFTTAPTANTAGDSPTDAAASAVVQGVAVGAGAAAVALTIDKLASGGTLELTAIGAGAVVNVKDALTGTADVLNVAANAATGDLGTVKAAEVETINVSVANKTTSFTTVYGDVKVADAASVSTLALDANAAKVVNVTGAGGLTLNIAAATKVAAVDASTATGALTLDLSAHTGVAVTVTGGAGNDKLSASIGANAKADVLVGGAGNDTLTAGSNGAKLTGGAGNDLFVLKAATKEANTHSSILDFQAGDVLKLEQSGAVTAIASFAKLGATLGTNAVFSDYANAAIAQAGANEAVWFQFGANAYVMVDQATSTDSFANGIDSVIELVGVNLANASFNSDYGTIALV